MKYSQYSSEKKGNSAFYIILAVCLLVVGVAAWFAFSNMASPTPDTKSEAPNQSEYNSNNSSYNSNNSDNNNNNNNDNNILNSMPDSTENMIPSTPTADEAESVPYTEAEKSYHMPVNGEILKDFSTTTLQYSATYGDMRIHNAVDIACKTGTIVTSCSDGVILSVEKSGTLGNVVTIDHGDGLIIKYAALEDVKLKNGDKVNGGDSIGSVGTIPSECSDQSHLHIEAYKNAKSISLLSLFE